MCEYCALFSTPDVKVAAAVNDVRRPAVNTALDTIIPVTMSTGLVTRAVILATMDLFVVRVSQLF